MLHVRVRSFLARHRALYWCGVGALAAGASLLVLDRVDRLERSRRAWGESRSVWVADHDLRPGDPVRAHPVTLPLAAVAPAALHLDPTAALAVQFVGEGEVLTSADLAHERADLLPAGHRGVAIAADDTTLALAPGDRVDVVAESQLLAADGVVVAVAPSSTTVAVPADAAAAVAFAAAQRTAVLVLRDG